MSELSPLGCEIPEPADRVRAVHFAVFPDSPIDDNVTVPPGTEGTITRVRLNVGQIGVTWDNGSTIMLLTTQDRWEIVR